VPGRGGRAVLLLGFARCLRWCSCAWCHRCVCCARTSACRPGAAAGLPVDWSLPRAAAVVVNDLKVGTVNRWWLRGRIAAVRADVVGPLQLLSPAARADRAARDLVAFRACGCPAAPRGNDACSSCRLAIVSWRCCCDSHANDLRECVGAVRRRRTHRTASSSMCSPTRCAESVSACMRPASRRATSDDPWPLIRINGKGGWARELHGGPRPATGRPRINLSYAVDAPGTTA